MEAYKIKEEFYMYINTIEELGEQVLYLKNPKLWAVNCNERSIETEMVNSNHINIYDFGEEECYLCGEYENPTEYINVPVDENQLKGVL